MISTDDSQTAQNPASQTAPVRLLSELERLLAGHGCPSCRHVEEVERSFFSWFEIESHTSSEMHAQLRGSMGLCPAHARRLLEGAGEGHVMTIAMREALAGARLGLRDDAQIGPCPACESAAFGARQARALLLDGLRDPAIARLYAQHEGVCLRHLLDAVPGGDARTVKMLAERLLGSLQDGVALVGLLGGLDADAPRRAMWRERLPQLAATGSTSGRLVERLEIDACPVCLAAGVAGRDHLRWFLARCADGDPSLDTDPGELCSIHLHDVSLANLPEGSNQALQRKRASRVAHLERLLGRLPRSSASGRRRRRSTGDELEQISGELLAAPHCAACHAQEGVERAQQDLVAASLGLAPLRDSYQRGHGLCVRHARLHPDGPTARLVRHHADARVALIAWEVQETARKYAWAFRHEPRGPERDGWLRGLAQIDGRVFQGCAPPVGEHQESP